MSKSNEELTAEITTSYIQSWNQRTDTKAVSPTDVCDLMKRVHKTLVELQNDYR